MALFFNLKILESEAQNNPEKLVTLLRYHKEGKTLASKYDKYKPCKESLKGNSFILNPDPVLYNRELDQSYLSQYIKLAGRRDLMMYKLHQFIQLDTSFFPELLLDKLKNNPLLKISNQLIYFKFEEIHCGSKVW